MKKIVCPYCDQPIDGKYCKGCRRIVWKPKQMEITYYLNEHHPENEEHCQFHGDILTGDMVEAKKAEIRERMLEKQRESAAKGKTVSIPNVPRKQQKPKKTAFTKSKTGLIIYFIIVFIGILAPIIGAVFDAVSDMGRRVEAFVAPEPVPEPMEAPLAMENVTLPAELEAVLENVVAEEELEEWERTDEQVKALGEACNGFGHSPVVYEEVEPVLMFCMDELGLEGEYDTYSYNQVMDHYTWFETTNEYVLSDENGYVGIFEINTDTATGQIHGISMYTHGEEEFFRMADLAMEFMNMTGMSETVPDGRSFYEESLLDGLQDDPGYRLQYGMEVDTLEPEPDEEDPFYKMSIYVPGYYTDITE